jgi:hypothetical protein
VWVVIEMHLISICKPESFRCNTIPGRIDMLDVEHMNKIIWRCVLVFCVFLFFCFFFWVESFSSNFLWAWKLELFLLKQETPLSKA